MHPFLVVDEGESVVVRIGNSETVMPATMALELASSLIDAARAAMRKQSVRAENELRAAVAGLEGR